MTFIWFSELLPGIPFLSVSREQESFKIRKEEYLDRFFFSFHTSFTSMLGRQFSVNVLHFCISYAHRHLSDLCFKVPFQGCAQTNLLSKTVFLEPRTAVFTMQSSKCTSFPEQRAGMLPTHYKGFGGLNSGFLSFNRTQCVYAQHF